MEYYGNAKLKEFLASGAVLDENSNYILPNGVILPDPDTYRSCSGVLPDGSVHNYSTRGRVLYYRPDEPDWPAKVVVLCPRCRGREEQRDALRALRRKERATPPPPAPEPPAAEAPPRSVDEVLCDLDELLGEPDANSP